MRVVKQLCSFDQTPSCNNPTQLCFKPLPYAITMSGISARLLHVVRAAAEPAFVP
jgi:hypothetical protein